MNVYKVGSFYPYFVVAARSEQEAIEVVKRDGSRPAEGAGERDHNGLLWAVKPLDLTQPGIIEGNAG